MADTLIYFEVAVYDFKCEKKVYTVVATLFVIFSLTRHCLMYVEFLIVSNNDNICLGTKKVEY